MVYASALENLLCLGLDIWEGIDSGCGTAPVEKDSDPDFFTQEIEELMPGNGVGQGCPAAENPGGGGGTWKDKPEQKPASSGAVDEKYPRVQRGGMGKRSGRELLHSLI